MHLIHAADGMIPSDMSTGNKDEIEEERRLLYVAMTRARRDLHLYFPLRYYHRARGLSDRHSYAQISRFLPDDVLALFERQATPAAAAATDEPLETPVGTPAAVDAFLAAHPNAAYYADFRDFAFWKLHVNAVRYIGGYGRMSWVTQADWHAAEPDPLASSAAGLTSSRMASASLARSVFT